MKNAFYTVYRFITVTWVIMALALFLHGCGAGQRHTAGPYDNSPKIVFFDSDKQQVNPGEEVWLEWATTNAREVKLSGIGNVATRGYRIVRPSQDTIYRLTAINASGETSSVVYLTVSHADSESTPPVIIYFRSDKQQVIEGETANLEWGTENADEVEISGVGRVETTGVQPVEPLGLTEYKLIARNKAGQEAAETVVVTQAIGQPQPTIIYFRSDTSEVVEGGTANLQWETENADEVEISGIGRVETTGVQPVEPRETTEYILIARNSAGGKAEKAVEIIRMERIYKPPPPPPRITHFKLDRESVKAGQAATLEWDTENATEVEIVGFGRFGPTGNKEVRSSKTTEIILIARNADGQETRSKVDLKITEESSLPVINYFKSDKRKVVEGEALTLEWATENAVKVQIQGLGTFEPAGHTKVRPRQNTKKYKLIAKNAAGKRSRAAVVEVTVVASSGGSGGDRPPSLRLTRPMQLSPKNGTKFSKFSRKTMLKWSVVKNAATYEVEVQECHPAGCQKDTKFFNRFKIPNQTEYRLDVSRPGYWRWQVWAVDRQGKIGPKSKWWEFRYPKR